VYKLDDISTFQVIELDVVIKVVVMIKCSTWKRRKRKIKYFEDQGKGIA